MVQKGKTQEHSSDQTNVARKSQMSEELGDSEFTASNGWLDRFKKRFNIKSKVISGEAGGVREDTVTSWQERLPNILSGYFPENIFNMDKTAQFFQALPNGFKAVYWWEKSKERVTSGLKVYFWLWEHLCDQV